MATNLNASVQVLAGGAGSGVSTDVTIYKAPLTFRYVGAVGDVVRVDLSGDNTQWALGVPFGVTATNEGEVCFVLPPSLPSANGDDAAASPNYVRVTVTSGNTGATATASVTAEPLATAKPSVALTVNNTTTPGAWGDCRTLGGPRTILYGGTAGDQIYLEGSDDGATLPYQVYPDTGTVAVGGASWSAVIEKLPNYMRVVRAAGTTAGSRCTIVGTDNSGGVLTNPWVQGGNAFAASGIVGTTDAFGMSVIGNNVSFLSYTLGGFLTVSLGIQATTHSLALLAGTGGIFGSSTGPIDFQAGTGLPLQILPSGIAAGQAGAIALRELAANGTNFAGWQAADNTTASALYQLPAAPPLIAGQSLRSAIAAGGLAATSWAGAVNVNATKSTAQTITDEGGATPVTGWTAVTNTTVSATLVFNAATGVATVPAGMGGFYNISAQIQFAATTADLGASFRIQIVVNGAPVCAYTFNNPVAALAQTRALPISAAITLAAGATVRIDVTLTGAGGNIDTTASAENNWLSISQV